MAGITFGFCDGASVSWKVEKAQVRVGVGLWGLANVVLVVTRATTHPMWYGKPEFSYMKDWIDRLLCDDTHIPDTASVSSNMIRMYRWRPKDAHVGAQNVVNYNSPCNARLSKEKPIRTAVAATMSGVGTIEKTRFEESLQTATYALQQISLSVTGESVSFGEFHWTSGSCNKTRALNSWERYSTSWKATGPPPCAMPRWTALSATVSDLKTPTTSLLSVSETIYYTDQSPTVVDIDDVVNILLDRAAVSDCLR